MIFNPFWITLTELLVVPGTSSTSPISAPDCGYIYIYIYIFWQHFFVNTNFIKHNWHFLSTYFLLDPFEFPYCFYHIQQEYHNQMHYNYKSDEKILKTLIHRNILPTDPNKKIKLIIYYNKFKTSNLVIRNNSSSSIGVLQKSSPDDGPNSGRKY